MLLNLRALVSQRLLTVTAIAAITAAAAISVACDAAAAPTQAPVVQTVVHTVIVPATAEPTTPSAATATERIVVVTATAAATATPQVIVVTATAVPTAVIPAPKVLTATAALRADNSLISMVDITVDHAAKVFVEYSNVDAGKFRTKTTAAAATTHSVPVVRLRPDSTYTYTAYAVDAVGKEYAGVTGSFKTGVLPADLAAIKMTQTGKATSELALMDIQFSAQSAHASGYFIMLDNAGSIVWYNATKAGPLGASQATKQVLAIKQKSNYNFVYMAGDGGSGTAFAIREITPLGDIVDELTAGATNKVPHHDFVLLPDDQILYAADITSTIDDAVNGGRAGQIMVADSLRIWDQKSGTTREVWKATDYWDPLKATERSVLPSPTNATAPWRWVHINSVTVGPRGNIIISERNRGQVVSIAPDYKKIEWALGVGSPDGPVSDFSWPKTEDKFWRQHTASQLSNGNILLFDNGADRPAADGGQYSRALEIAIDGYELTAKKVWEYKPATAVYASFISSAWRLENGNTLVNFGARTDFAAMPYVAVEVQRDGVEVWKMDMQVPDASGRFRVYAQKSIMGETRIGN